VRQKELDGQFALVLHNDVLGLKKVPESVSEIGFLLLVEKKHAILTGFGVELNRL